MRTNLTTSICNTISAARYTYNYVKEDGIWKIQHHHSSVMPEGIAMGKPITDDEVRGLFNLWNDALATLDPKAVATRYAKKGESIQYILLYRKCFRRWQLTIIASVLCRRSPPNRERHPKD